MAITYPIELPTEAKVSALGFQPEAVVAAVRSPFTFSEEVQVWDGQAWQVTITLAPRRGRVLGAPITAFLLKLNGMEGSFLFGDPLGQVPRGIATGTPLVDGAQSARARVLLTKGWSVSTTNILRAGDYIQLGSGATARLHMVLNNVNSDNTGKASLDLWPALRVAVSNNAALTVTGCKGVFRLADNAMPWNLARRNQYSISFQAREVI